jgi:hypothetical protein
MFLSRRAFSKDASELFFGGSGIGLGIPPSGGDGKVERQSHDQQQAGEAFGMLDLGILDAETARLEVREHRLDGPARRIFKCFQIARRGGHGDDPGLGVAGIVNDADVGGGPFRRQLYVLQREEALLGHVPGGRPLAGVTDHQIAFQPDTVVPSLVLAQGDQVALRANEDETSAPRKFKLEGVGNLFRGHAQQDAPASR